MADVEIDEDAIRAAFSYFDKDGNGYASLSLLFGASSVLATYQSQPQRSFLFCSSPPLPSSNYF